MMDLTKFEETYFVIERSINQENLTDDQCTVFSIHFKNHGVQEYIELSERYDLVFTPEEKDEIMNYANLNKSFSDYIKTKVGGENNTYLCFSLQW